MVVNNFFPVVITDTYVVSVSIGSDLLPCIFCELEVVIGAKLMGSGGRGAVYSRPVSAGSKYRMFAHLGGCGDFPVSFPFRSISPFLS